MKWKPLFSSVPASLHVWLRFGLWAITIIVVISNIALRIPHGSTVAIPSTFLELTSTARQVWKNGFTKQANTELQLANESGVLGATDNKSLLTQWQEEKNKLEYQYHFWLSIIEEHPQYRDGYLEVARLAYELGNVDEAKTFIEKAKQVDPNTDYSSYLRIIEE